MADETESVTVEILRAIRDELSGLRGDTNSRFEELRADTNARLDFLATEGDIIRDLKTRMTRVEPHLGLGD